MRIVLYCPTEIKEIKEIFVPTREAFLLFLPFLRDLKHAGWLDLFRRAKPFCNFFDKRSGKADDFDERSGKADDCGTLIRVKE